MLHDRGNSTRKFGRGITALSYRIDVHAKREIADIPGKRLEMFFDVLLGRLTTFVRRHSGLMNTLR